MVTICLSRDYGCSDACVIYAQ